MRLSRKQYLNLVTICLLLVIAPISHAQVHCPTQKISHNNLKREIYICGLSGGGEGISIEAFASKECRKKNNSLNALELNEQGSKRLLRIDLDTVDLIPGVRIPLVTSGYMATDCIKDSIEVQSCRDYYYKSNKLGTHKIGTLCDLSSTQELGQRDPIALALGEPQFMKTNWSWAPIVNSKRKIADADFCLYGLDSNSEICSEKPSRE
ncbi:MAG: hypothetical protein KBD78_15950 [Oligoflexales bacterium]|nr:hypothetical protein [Oligoflexales bacterium]